jgi:predicted SprT family Zn-dependent metalloprotease
MTLHDAELLMHQLMEKHGVVGVTFRWRKRLKRWGALGSYHHQKKTISLQPNFVELNSDEAVTEVMLHEIAHALTPNHRHNKYWKAKAVEIGCKPDKTFRGELKYN